MPYPKVTVKVTNGNLLRSITVEDGVGAIAATVSTAALKGETQQVYSLKDAVSKGYTEDAEPFMYKLIKEFYSELGGNMRLFVFGLAAETSMAEAVDSTNEQGLIKMLTAAGGDITLVALARKPTDGYDAGAAFLDSDVSATVTASLALCQNMQQKNTPIRLLIEGRVANGAVANTFKPSEGSNGYAAVVLGGTSNDGSAAVSVALARACKYGAHIKIGSGQNGALSAVSQVYIGNDRIEDRLDMETLHDDGFLTFQVRAGAAGYYFGRDNMCSSDDYSILVHGRIIDKATRVIAAAYLPYIEDIIHLNSDGSIDALDAQNLENVLGTAINANMGEQISDSKVVIDTNQNIVNTSKLEVGCRILPLGYSTWINVTLGLTAQTAE